MTVTSLPVGSIGTNCYLLYDETTKDAAVIDRYHSRSEHKRTGMAVYSE